MEEPAPIPIEWIDADEWEAIEQALEAAATATSQHTPEVKEFPHTANSSVDLHGLNGFAVCSADQQQSCEDSKKVGGRSLPAWGHKTQVIQPKVIQPKVIKETLVSAPLELKSDDEVKPVVVQTNLRHLTDSWATGRFDNTAKVQSRSQSLQFKGRLVYSKTHEEVDEAAHAISEMIVAKRGSTNVAMGFDLEWKTSFQRGEAPGKVAVVQLCVDSGRCDVMHIFHSGIPPSLVTILEDPSILKTGVGSHGDAAKLQRDYGVESRGVIDLSEMAGQKLGRRWQSWSLSSLAQELTCKKVEKISSIRCGDWEACPLSPPQLQYAATDAFASLYLYQILETFSDHELKSEDSNGDLQSQ